MSSFSFYFHADDRAAASFRSHFTVDIARFQIKRRLTAAGILFDKLSGLAVGKRVGNFLVTSENQLDLAVFISDSIQRAERKQRNDIAALHIINARAVHAVILHKKRFRAELSNRMNCIHMPKQKNRLLFLRPGPRGKRRASLLKVMNLPLHTKRITVRIKMRRNPLIRLAVSRRRFNGDKIFQQLHHTVFVFLEIGKCLFRSFIHKHSPFLMFYKVIFIIRAGRPLPPLILPIVVTQFSCSSRRISRLALRSVIPISAASCAEVIT